MIEKLAGQLRGKIDILYMIFDRHLLNSTHLSLTKTDRNCTLFSCDFDPLFHFPSLSQKPILHFCGTRGKMNTGKKHFDLARRNGVAGTREVSKGGPGRPAFGTRSCSQGLVCYTFCSAKRAKGWCRLPGQHTFTRRKQRPKTAKG